MALHFERREYAARVDIAAASLGDRGLDGLLMFAQESMYYLTGYDTFGFCFFQCLYLGADGTQALLTRMPDLRQAQHTSTLEDIRVWTDEKGARPETQLFDMLDDLGCRGKRLGIEYNSYGLSAALGKAVDGALDGFCTLEDASDLVSQIRVVKSPAELAYVRRAGELADDALAAAVAASHAGADEGDILAQMQGAVFAGGGDYPGNEFIIGSGADALLVRYKSGRRKLSDTDQMTIEFAGAYRHYHAALMRTVIIGEPSAQHRAMYSACRDALAACEEQLRPGKCAGDVFDAHARVMDAAGMRDHRMNACGYCLGAKFTPTWMDWPMFYHGNDAPIGSDMVFFAHMIAMDSVSGNAMTLARTYIITDEGPQSVSGASLDLIVK